MFSNRCISIIYLFLFIACASVYAMNPSEKVYKKVLKELQKTFHQPLLSVKPISHLEGAYEITTLGKKKYYFFFRALKPKSERITYAVVVDAQKTIFYFRFIEAPFQYGGNMARKRWAKEKIGQACSSPRIDAISGATLSVKGIREDLKKTAKLVQSLAPESNNNP